MPFRLVLAHVVTTNILHPTERLEADLLRRANAWLARRVGGHPDDLLIIGDGFEDEAKLKAALGRYGLAEVECAVGDSSDDTEGDAPEVVVEDWVRARHAGAIPIVLPTPMAAEHTYPTDGWWWSALEAADDESESVAEALTKYIPWTYSEQTLTWAEVLAWISRGASSDGYLREYEEVMLALTFARWLCGFDVATENSWFGFAYEEIASDAGIDLLRLGLETALEVGATSAHKYQDGSYDRKELHGMALKTCLEARTSVLRADLSDAFGGDSQLFWSLYSSIWPDWTLPIDQAMLKLLSLERVGYRELERPWLFVTEGWADFADE